MPDTIYVSASGPCFKGDKEEHKRKYGIFFGKLLQYLSQLQTEAYSGSQLLNEPFSRFETRLKRVDCTSDAIKVHKGFFDSSTTSIKAAPSQLMDANGSMVLERTLASSSYGQHLLSSSPQPLFVNVKRVIETVNTHNDPILIIAYKDDTVRVVKGKRSLDGADISKEHINLEDLKTIGDEDDVNKIIVSTTMTKEKRTAYFENVKPFGKDTVFKVTSSFQRHQPRHTSRQPFKRDRCTRMSGGKEQNVSLMIRQRVGNEKRKTRSYLRWASVLVRIHSFLLRMRHFSPAWNMIVSLM